MPTLTADQVKELAHALHRAEHDLNPISPLTEQYPSMDMDDAYAVQLEGVRERMERHGGEIVGWKIGLTSKAMQQMLNVDQPDFGHLLDGMRMDEGADITVAEMIWPRVEPEIAFQLKADLRARRHGRAGHGRDRVPDPGTRRSSTAGCATGRSLCDTIADNASCGRFVWDVADGTGGFDQKLIGMNYYVDDNLSLQPPAPRSSGDPAAAVAWLANTLAPYGHYLHAGQVVMPGSLVAAVDAKPGGTIRADFAHIGSVTLKLK